MRVTTSRSTASPPPPPSRPAAVSGALAGELGVDGGAGRPAKAASAAAADRARMAGRRRRMGGPPGGRESGAHSTAMSDSRMMPEPGRKEIAMRPITAADLMNPKVLAVREDMTLRELAASLIRHQITGAPVEDGGGRLVGVVSTVDIAEAMLAFPGDDGSDPGGAGAGTGADPSGEGS